MEVFIFMAVAVAEDITLSIVRVFNFEGNIIRNMHYSKERDGSLINFGQCPKFAQIYFIDGILKKIFAF